MIIYTVRTNHNGGLYYLRSTVWTSDSARATTHTSEQDARNALNAARKFMAAKVYRAAFIHGERV